MVRRQRRRIVLQYQSDIDLSFMPKYRNGEKVNVNVENLWKSIILGYNNTMEKTRLTQYNMLCIIMKADHHIPFRDVFEFIHLLILTQFGKMFCVKMQIGLLREIITIIILAGGDWGIFFRLKCIRVTNKTQIYFTWNLEIWSNEQQRFKDFKYIFKYTLGR